MPASRSKAAAAIFIFMIAGFPVPTAGIVGPAANIQWHASTDGRVAPAPDKLSSAELLSQDLTVYLYPENQSIAVEGSLRLRANVAITKLTMYLHETLDLLNITENGQPLLYTRTVERLTIDLSAQLAANATTNLSFHYNGTMWYLDNGKRQDCVGWEGAYVKGSTFWYLRHHASDWADYRLKFCCPPSWTAVADGELVAEEHSAEWSNYTWVNDLPCLRPAFAAGNYSVASRSSGGTNISVWTYPEHSGMASAYLDESASVFSFYEAMLGQYGRKSFKIVETAHETMSGYACSGFVMLYPAAFSGGTVRYNLLAHETGHMWFPYATGYQGWAYPWLWEAFPEYLSCIYEMEQHGVRTRLDYDYNEYVKVHALPDIRSISSSDWDTPYSSQIVYAKGAWVLRMLQGIVGAGGFNAILNEYVDRNLWGYGSVQAFVAAAARHSPVRLEDFWEQWLNTTKALDVSLPVVRQYENGTSFRLELEPANLLNGSNPADALIEYTDGTSGTVRMGWDGKSAQVVMEVPSSVRQVRLDADGWLLDVERSNQAAVPIQSGKLYEFQLEPIAIPNRVIEGVKTTLTVDVRNNCDYLADGVNLSLFDNDYLDTNLSLKIAARGFVRVDIPWTGIYLGDHDIDISIDSWDLFHEWNEMNNRYGIFIFVDSPPPKMDLWCGNLSVDSPAPMEGDSVALSAQVKNTGGADTGQFVMTLAVDDERPKSMVEGPMAPGECATLRLVWKAVRGMHMLSAAADSTFRIEEADEQNNQAILSFFVGWPLDLNATFLPAAPRTFETVTIIASGPAEEFSFDFGDGRNQGWGPDSTATHQYDRCGNYTVTINGRVRDRLEENTTIIIPVLNRAPELNAWGEPSSPLSRSEVQFTARVRDLDGTVVRTWWDFGDGSLFEGSRAAHNYSRPGIYNVTFSAQDDAGGRNSTRLVIDVLNRLPAITGSFRVARLKDNGCSFAADANDLDGHITRYLWDFGDGTSAEGQSVVHRYKNAGPFDITLVVFDDYGGKVNRTERLVLPSERQSEARTPAVVYALIPFAIVFVVLAFLLFIQQRKRQRDAFFKDPGNRRGQNP